MAYFAPKISMTPTPIYISNHKTAIPLQNPFFSNHSSFGCRKLHQYRLSVFCLVNGGGVSENGVREMERPRVKRVTPIPNLSEEQKRAISQLPPKMTNRSKDLMKQIICFSAENRSVHRMLAAWVKNTRPPRADWLAVLKELERLDHPLYFEVDCLLLHLFSPFLGNVILRLNVLQLVKIGISLLRCFIWFDYGIIEAMCKRR